MRFVKMVIFEIISFWRKIYDWEFKSDFIEVFGVRDYRTYFANMFREFDPVIWSKMLNSDEVAAHLFTASPQTGISKDSTIFNLLRVGGVDGATDNSASWRHVKEQRRNLLSSLYYLDYGSAATSKPPLKILINLLNSLNLWAEWQRIHLTYIDYQSKLFPAKYHSPQNCIR